MFAAEVRLPPRADAVAFAAPTMNAPEIVATTTTGTVEAAVAAGDVLETGDRGPAVHDLQHRLVRLGYGLAIDGQLGPGTAAVVQRFQQEAGVAPTGRVGPTTLLALRVAEASRSDIAIAPLFPSVGAGRHLRSGDRGIEVATLQRLLTVAGHPVDADGAFGPATRDALVAFQQASRIAGTGEVGPTTLRALDARVDSLGVSMRAVLDLPSGYGSLEKLAGELVGLDARFAPATLRGRATLAMALAIGGTEVYGQGSTGTDFFTVLGGTNNNMRGFAQFNLDYHDAKTRTPADYAAFLADILHGLTRMPNSTAASDHAGALASSVADGRIRNPGDLRFFLDSRGFGGSNWQGIDDGWARVPGLEAALMRFLQFSAPSIAPVFT